MKRVIIVVLMIMTAAFAIVQPVPDAELISSADDIIKATVISSKCEWNTEKTVIFTFVQVRVDKVYKGNMTQQSVQTLAIPGGYDPITDLRLTVSDQPSFKIDEETVLYLSAAKGMADGINYQLFAKRADFRELKRVNFFSQGKHPISQQLQFGEQVIFKVNDDETIDLKHYEALLQGEISRQEREDVK